MHDDDEPYRVHERFKLEVVRVGAEKAPVLVVENFLSNAEALVEIAAAHAVFAPVTGIVYPGVRAPMPDRYNTAFHDLLGPAIRETFGFGRLGVLRSQCDFSMVTVRPQSLHLTQRVPHIDGTEPTMIAAVHYLCVGGQGGTSFYRHRRTGFESIDESRKGAYFRALNDEAKIVGLPAMEYINGDSAQFERIASFDAVFNRIVVYRGCVLHSGNIAREFSFDANPRSGRLTANTFYLFG